MKKGRSLSAEELEPRVARVGTMLGVGACHARVAALRFRAMVHRVFRLSTSPERAPDENDEEQEPYELPDYLTDVAPLAEAVLALSERLDGLYEEDDDEHEETIGDEPAGPPEAIVQLLRELSKAALEFAGALEGDEEALQELDEWSQERELIPRLLELPLGLVEVGALDSALAVARAFTFVAAEACDGDIAIIFAEAGKRDEAIAQLESNLNRFPESWLTAVKAGAAYEALSDAAAAEASYRRAMVLADDESQEDEAATLLAGLLEDLGRLEEEKIA